MTIALQIDFHQRHVIIIGAGNVALRKAKTFLADGAEITVIAPFIHEEFYTLPLEIIRKEYALSDIKGAFLVIAATNHRILNEQIVKDAKLAGTLVMGIQNTIGANVFSMVQCTDETCTLAMSTNGSYPSANRYLIHKMQHYIHQNYSSRLRLLKQIRDHCMNEQLSFTYYNELLSYDDKLLEILLLALQRKRLCLCVYHGTSNQQAHADIISFEKKFKERYTHIVISHAFISKSIHNTTQQGTIQIFSYEQILPILHALCVNVYVIPMVICEGYYHRLIETIANQYHMFLVPSPFSDILSNLDYDSIQSYHTRNGQILIFVYHGNSFVNLNTNIKLSNQVLLWSIEEFKQRIQKVKHAYVYPMFVLKGKHHAELRAYETSFITIRCQSLLENTEVQEALIHYLSPYVDHIVS